MYVLQHSLGVIVHLPVLLLNTAPAVFKKQTVAV